MEADGGAALGEVRFYRRFLIIHGVNGYHSPNENPSAAGKRSSL
jgi:hypothetical protein